MRQSIEDQVRTLMQGTEYGDPELKSAMEGELRERLTEAGKEDRPLRVYCGFDPRTSDLHLGHTVPIRKLRQFQELGHEVSIVVGTFTSLIGDPSDKTGLRPLLGREEAAANGRTYAEQAFRILDPAKTLVRFNHEWLEKLSFADVIGLASNFSVQQFLTRENFKLRFRNGDPVYLHETFYSLMQGYDAFHLRADVQVGGTDQVFNIVTAARKIMSGLGVRPNTAVIVRILPGTDGEVKMSKSLGNHIPILSAPADMYGKIMSLPDGAMRPFFELVTGLDPSEIGNVFRDLDSGGAHPRDVKMRLARETVSAFHTPELARVAEEEFVRIFRNNEAPRDIPVFRVRGRQSVVDVMAMSGMARTKSEARRLISQMGVRADGRIVSDPGEPVTRETVLQAGKRRFVRIVVEEER
jgi:tyrosyl-tRNA synthetase